MDNMRFGEYEQSKYNWESAVKIYSKIFDARIKLSQIRHYHVLAVLKNYWTDLNDVIKNITSIKNEN